MPFVSSGNVNVNTKGISTFPNLTLGKPAAVFDFTFGRRLTFEPIFRFALEGRPWTFILWWRYKLVQKEKFRLSLGAHPAFSFTKQQIQINSGTRDIVAVYRYLATEVNPAFTVSKKVTIGLNWIYARGVEEVLIRNTNFLSLRAGISNIRIGGDYYIRINPQVYYLNMDGSDGFYFNTVAGLSKLNCPFSVGALINNPIKTDIAAGNEFLWNVGITYTFSLK